MNVAARRVAALWPVRRVPSYTTATTTGCCRLTTSSQDLCRVSKVPQQPHVSPLQPLESLDKPQVDLRLVQLLEKLSLVDFANEDGITRLQAAISMADQLSQVDTTGVEPLITILEDRPLPLAEDEVMFGNQKDELLACAHTTLDDYYVVPPGNITFEEERGYHASLKQQQQGKEEWEE